MRKAGITVTPQRVAADSEAVHTLVGESAPHRMPAPEVVAAQPNRAPSTNGAGQRRGRGNAPAAHQPGRNRASAPRRRSSGARTH